MRKNESFSKFVVIAHSVRARGNKVKESERQVSAFLTLSSATELDSPRQTRSKKPVLVIFMPEAIIGTQAE